MKVYISLPITGHNINQVRKRAEQAASHLRALGHEPVSPLELHPDQECTYGQFMGRDIEVLIDQCEAIYFLKGWISSNGCKLEWYCSCIHNKQMMFEDGRVPGHPFPVDNKSFVSGWIIHPSNL